jgi:Protein of unknown function (DUF1566)
MKQWKVWAAAAGLVATAGVAQAALVNRGGGMIYDTTRNITWLADMNQAATSGFAAANAGGTGSSQIDALGRMGWDAATGWAEGLVHRTYDDWRLPDIDQLTGLFETDLGSKPNQPVPETAGDTPEQIANLRLFTNLQTYYYWSSTELNQEATRVYNTARGNPTADFKETLFYAVAVRTGNVATAVPEPQTMALTLLALGATWAARRRRPC